MTRIRSVFVLASWWLGLAWPGAALAHTGPPFPIVVDQPIPGYVVSVWTDPDVGEATFFVMLEPGEGRPVGPAVSEVEVAVQPVSGRLPKVQHRATQEAARGHLRFVAQPEFDAAEFWMVEVVVRLADGTDHLFVTEVEATPPGIGPWGVLLFLAPFLLFGGLWVMVFVRRGRKPRMHCAAVPAKAGTGMSARRNPGMSDQP